MRVVVLGAGVIGVTTAFELHADGHDVCVLDRRGGPAEETSFANAGLIAPGHSYTWASPKAPRIMLRSLYQRDQALRFKPRLDPELYLWSARFLRNCTAERSRTNTLRKLRLCTYAQDRLHHVVAETGVGYDASSGGLFYLYRDPAAFARGQAAMDILRDGGRRMESLDVDGIVALDPAFASARGVLAGAVFCPDDEGGDAHVFTRGLAAWLAERGVEFRYGVNVLGFDVAGDRVESVQTTSGPIAGDAYVLALGTASARLGRRLGLRLPIYPIKGYSVTFPLGEEPPAHGGVDEQSLTAFCPMGDRLRLTSTAEFAGYDTSHEPGDFDAMIASAQALLPRAADWSRPSYWAGLRPMTPEGTPIMGHGAQRNLYLNAGHGHMGWTMACGSARIVADIVRGERAAIDLRGMTLAGAEA